MNLEEALNTAEEMDNDEERCEYVCKAVRNAKPMDLEFLIQEVLAEIEWGRINVGDGQTDISEETYEELKEALATAIEGCMPGSEVFPRYECRNK